MDSREKIHQFVNMARHPEAKDLEEALEMESKYNDCQILHTYGNQEPRIINVQEFDWLRSEIYGSGEIKNKILGRPITAFDVCWALNKKHNPDNTYYFDLKLYNIRNMDISQCMLVRSGGSKNNDKDGLIYFDMKKPDGTDIFLTERSDEVCDKIAEFINL